MSRLLLVRHGKASDHWFDYDRLSPAGTKQAEHFGARLVREETTLAAVYHGKMRRQRETAEAVRSVFVSAGRSLPELRELPGLDEMAPGVIDAALLAETDVALRQHVTAWVNGQLRGTREVRRFLMSAFLRFARAEISGDFETYAEFRARVSATLDAMIDEDRGTVVAFTSGGFIATAAGIALETALEPTLQLMAAVENASLTELRHSRTRDRFLLVRLNDVGHLPSEERTFL